VGRGDTPVDTGVRPVKDVGMRPEDDASDSSAAADTSLADGFGETVEPGDDVSSTDPYGDEWPDEPYGDGDGDEPTDDSTSDSYDEDEGDGGYSDTYGDGDGSTTVEPETDDTGIFGPDEPDTLPSEEDASVELDLESYDASPLEGIGYLLDQVRDALVGDDEGSGASPFDADPGDIASDSDLDLTGDGLVDGADLDEAGHVLDFGVEGGHHG